MGTVTGVDVFNLTIGSLALIASLVSLVWQVVTWRASGGVVVARLEYGRKFDVLVVGGVQTWVTQRVPDEADEEPLVQQAQVVSTAANLTAERFYGLAPAGDVAAPGSVEADRNRVIVTVHSMGRTPATVTAIRFVRQREGIRRFGRRESSGLASFRPGRAIGDTQLPIQLGVGEFAELEYRRDSIVHSLINGVRPADGLFQMHAELTLGNTRRIRTNTVTGTFVPATHGTGPVPAASQRRRTVVSQQDTDQTIVLSSIRDDDL